VVPTRGNLVGDEAAFSTSPDHRVLADAEKACRLPAADQLGAADKTRCCCKCVILNVLEAKPVMSTGRGYRRREGSPRNGAKNSRLTDAQALGGLPRTDQSVQDVCRTNAAL
jgi:hypothetical protein